MVNFRQNYTGANIEQFSEGTSFEAERYRVPMGVKDMSSLAQGAGIGIGFVDQFLPYHKEYGAKIRLYEEVGFPEEARDVRGSMHGPAVCGIAIGESVGVAKKAHGLFVAANKLINVAEYRDFKHQAEAIDLLLQRREEHNLRIISMSVGWDEKKGDKNIPLLMEAIKQAEDQGVYVVSCSHVTGNAFGIGGMRRVIADDQSESYEPPSWLEEHIKAGGKLSAGMDKKILVPAENIMLPSPADPGGYYMSRQGGLSWGVPYLAGLVGCVMSVAPFASHSMINQLIVESAQQEVTVNVAGQDVSMGRVIDPSYVMNKVFELHRALARDRFR